MKLKIGVFGFQPGWKTVLQQEGITCENITAPMEISKEEYSVLIIGKELGNLEKEAALKYIKSGGAALVTPKAKFFPYKKIRKKYLIAERNSFFSSVGLVDLFDNIFVPKRDLQILDSGLKIHTQKIGRGTLLTIPFDLNKLMLNAESLRKRFWDDRKELSSEIVSKVSKGKLRRIVRICLEYLHSQRDLPFVQKWYYPKDSKNIFIFRVDDDSCKPEEAQKLYELCRKFDLKASWFLVADSHTRLIKSYANFDSQELALHGFRHQTYKNYHANYANLKKGKKVLKNLNFPADGFASPFGAWNINLAKAIDKLSFKYSSEFALDYDNFPFFSEFIGANHQVLQIPIHPISIGRLRRSHYSPMEMEEYYQKVIHRKLILGEPLIFYHHPHHKRLGVIEKIFETVQSQEGILNYTMAEFCKWWKQRIKTDFQLEFKDNRLKILTSNRSAEIYLRVVIDGNKENIIKPVPEISMDEIDWKNVRNFSYPNEIKKIRRWHWRDLLYNYESKRARKTLYSDIL